MQARKSFFGAPTMAGRVTRIAMLVVLVLIAAVLIMGSRGYALTSKSLYYGLFLLLLAGGMVLAILGVRKRVKEKTRKTATICLSILFVLVLVLLYSQTAVLSSILQYPYATVTSPGGQKVAVLRTYIAMGPDATIFDVTSTEAEPKAIDPDALTTYALYEAYPVKYLFFHDRNARVEGVAFTTLELETGAEGHKLLVEWTAEGARFYMEGADPAVNGEIFVYFTASEE